MTFISFVTVPPRPVIAIVSGACEYGLDMKAVSTRVLKWSYGVDFNYIWVSINSKKKVNNLLNS